MGRLATVWRRLFAKALKSGKPQDAVAEEGYYLLAAPGAGEPVLEEPERIRLTWPRLGSLVERSTELFVVHLECRYRYRLPPEYDYHHWAGEFAEKLRRFELATEAAVDVARFLRLLQQQARAAGWTLQRRPGASGPIILTGTRFRQGFNLRDEMARMVVAARDLREQADEILKRARGHCTTLEAYAQRFFQIFAEYRPFVTDHYFVAGRGDVVAYLDYWALLGHPTESEAAFRQGVQAVARVLDLPNCPYPLPAGVSEFCG